MELPSIVGSTASLRLAPGITEGVGAFIRAAGLLGLSKTARRTGYLVWMLRGK